MLCCVVCHPAMFNYLSNLFYYSFTVLSKDILKLKGYFRMHVYTSLPYICYVSQVQRDCADLLSSYFTADGLVARCLQYATHTLDHIMDFTRLRAFGSLFSMLNQMIRNILNYNQFHPDFPLQV